MDPGVSTTVAAPGRGQRLSVPVAAPLAAYLLARAVTLAVVMLTPSGVSVARRVLAFDAGWYALIATNGYPHSVAQGPDGVIANRVGFFPAYPLLVRGLQAATPLPVWAAELAVSLIAGAAATVLVAAVCAEVSGWGDQPARRCLLGGTPAVVPVRDRLQRGPVRGSGRRRLAPAVT
jgi:hypothetical protein